MSPEIASLATGTGHQITVRTRSGGMLVAAVWQVLTPVAHDVERVQIAARSERGFEDMTASFTETFAGSLNDVLREFEKMPWVATVELC
jgi:hypothetical protein